MGLDIYLFKHNVDFQDNRNKRNELQTKLWAIKDKIERLEDEYESAKLFSADITHNLNEMAQAVGLHDILWNPEKISITVASQVILPLEKGIKELEANPDKYKAYNPPNGWGSYEDFVSFCKSVLQKCREYPDAVIEAAG